MTVTASTVPSGEPDAWLGQALACLNIGVGTLGRDGCLMSWAGPLFELMTTPPPHRRAGTAMPQLCAGLTAETVQPQLTDKSRAPARFRAHNRTGQVIGIELRHIDQNASVMRVQGLSPNQPDPEFDPTAAMLRNATTMLPSRALLVDRLHVAIERAKRVVTDRIALMILSVADTEAASGEAEAVRVAPLLADALRVGDTLAHIDVDTFAVLLDPIRGDATTAQVVVASTMKRLNDVLTAAGVDPGAIAMGRAIGDGMTQAAEMLVAAEPQRNPDIGGMVTNGLPNTQPGAPAGMAEPANVPDPASVVTPINGAGAIRRSTADAPDVAAARLAVRPHRSMNQDQVVCCDIAVVVDGVRGTGTPDAESTAEWIVSPTHARAFSDLLARGAASLPIETAHLDSVTLELAQLPPLTELDRWVRALRGSLSRVGLAIDIAETAMVRDPDGAVFAADALRARAIDVGIVGFGRGVCTDALVERLQPQRLRLAPSLMAEACEPGASGRVHLASAVGWAHTRGLMAVMGPITSAHELAVARDFGCDRVFGPHIGDWQIVPTG